MKFANATNLNRKSGVVVQWSDLRCAFLPGIFATRANLHLYFQRLRGWPIQAIFWLEWDTFPAPSCTPLEQSLNEPHSQLMRPE
jgi:hypothetical protein